MKRRKWSSEQKLKIVLVGLSGQIEMSKQVPDLLNHYIITGESNYSTLVIRLLRRKA